MSAILGILSDSHGDAKATARAVSLLKSRGATRLVHCGDICSESVLSELAGHACTFVWGNCDYPEPAMRRLVDALGLSWPEGPVKFEFAGKQIGVFHGHERAFDSIRYSPNLDYVCYGHSHQYADERIDGCRFINPGALYRAAVHTVATLDVEADALTFLELETGKPLATR